MFWPDRLECIVSGPLPHQSGPLSLVQILSGYSALIDYDTPPTPAFLCLKGYLYGTRLPIICAWITPNTHVLICLNMSVNQSVQSISVDDDQWEWSSLFLSQFKDGDIIFISGAIVVLVVGELDNINTYHWQSSFSSGTPVMFAKSHLILNDFFIITGAPNRFFSCMEPPILLP